MSRRVVAILNPISGRRSMIPLVRRVQERVRAGGGRFTLKETAGPGHATELARLAASEADAILAVGGDGTACEVVNGLLEVTDAPRPDLPCPIMVLGAGTENLLARELGMPTAPDRVARTLLYGESAPFDVGVINGRRFLAVSGVGFDAECVLRMARFRTGHITYWDYFWPIWRTFWAHRFPELRVEVESGCIFEGRGAVLIGNISLYSINLRILSQARYDDGLLDVCVLPCASRIKLAHHAYRVYRGDHAVRGGAVYVQSRWVRVRSPDTVPVEIDGEVGGVLPIDCSILPGAVRLLRPI